MGETPVTNSRSMAPARPVPAFRAPKKLRKKPSPWVVVRLRAPVGEDGVGEVVVLVDQDVERDAVVPGVQEQRLELSVDRRGREDGARRVFVEQVAVAPQGVLDMEGAVTLEALLQGRQRLLERGEVEVQHHVAAAVARGPLADVGAGEDGVELVGHGAIVVGVEHGQPQRLAEAPRADEEDEAFLLQGADEAGLVHVEAAVEADAAEVAAPVGDRRVLDRRVGHGSLHRCTGSGRV